jgi:hypothetical protein
MSVNLNVSDGKLVAAHHLGTPFWKLVSGSGPFFVDCFVEGILNSSGYPEVVNSIVESKKKDLLRGWKGQVCSGVRASRHMSAKCVPSLISVAFFLAPGNHGNRSCDIENFVKPVVDGATMGLWGESNPQDNSPCRYDADDSVFAAMYLQHCPIVDRRAEGVFVTVSSLLEKIN